MKRLRLLDCSLPHKANVFITTSAIRWQNFLCKHFGHCTINIVFALTSSKQFQIAVVLLAPKKQQCSFKLSNAFCLAQPK